MSSNTTTRPRPEIGVAIPKRRLSDEEDAELRAAKAEWCLWELLKAAKDGLDPASWVNAGLAEAEAFLDAIYTGGRHPLLATYEARAKEGGRRSAPANEIAARRYTVLACVALQRAGLGVGAARKRVAEALRHTHVFPSVPSTTAIEHWERDLQPPVTPIDQVVLARGIAQRGIKDLRGLTLYFVELAASVRNPVAVMVPR